MLDSQWAIVDLPGSFHGLSWRLRWSPPFIGFNRPTIDNQLCQRSPVMIHHQYSPSIFIIHIHHQYSPSIFTVVSGTRLFTIWTFNVSKYICNWLSNFPLFCWGEAPYQTKEALIFSCHSFQWVTCSWFFSASEMALFLLSNPLWIFFLQCCVIINLWK